MIGLGVSSKGRERRRVEMRIAHWDVQDSSEDSRNAIDMLP